MFLPTLNQYFEIGTYSGYTVILGDLAPSTFDNVFKIKSSNSTVILPHQEAVDMLYQYFLKEFWNSYEKEKHTKLNAFGHFTVRFCCSVTRSSFRWDQEFWQAKVLEYKENGILD